MRLTLIVLLAFAGLNASSNSQVEFVNVDLSLSIDSPLRPHSKRSLLVAVSYRLKGP